MVKDQAKLGNIRASWETVRIVQEKVRANLNAAMVIPVLPQTDEFRNLVHSLVLIYAFSVLEDTLLQLRDEGLFACRGRELKRLMEDSKEVLPWVDYAKVDTGRDKRNGVAHRRQYIPRAECWDYIDVIENELVAWKVLPGKVQAESTITRAPLS